jgi:nucleoside-diphosphate-sugar epimerase
MEEYDRIPELIDSAECFFHLAWEGARVPYRDDRSMQKNNYDCTLKAYEAAKKLGCRLFLGSGSQAEYGSTTGLVDENYPCNPKTEYGKQKLNSYRELQKRAAKDGVKLIWTRIFSLYGPYDYPGTLVMTSIDKMLKDESIEMTEGTQLWDYLYVSDAAAAMVLLSEKDCESGVYNIASGEYKPLRTYIEEMKEILNSKSDLRFGVIPYGINGPVNLTPNSAKVKMLGWKPNVSFNEGINSIVRCIKGKTNSV